MKIRFWGVRGSIAVPGAKTVRYGGNTTCIEVITDEGEHIILDAGTGIFPLAQTLLRSMPLSVHIFLTHTHWDHIQGLPFFIPIFVPGNHVAIFGAFDPISGRGVQEILSRQMEYAYFPVRECELKAVMDYHTLREGETITIGKTRVSNILMNHPVLNFGYKIENNGKKMFFTGDHEVPFNIYSEDDEYYPAYQALLNERYQTLIDFFHGVDLLIADSAYSKQEYPAKKGWGHGTMDSSIILARDAGVKRLLLTHHEPTRSDDDLEKLFTSVMQDYPNLGFEVLLAKEGAEITI